MSHVDAGARRRVRGVHRSLSALLAIVAGRVMKTARAPAGCVAATASLALGLAAIALQCIEYLHQSFGPTRGAFASVFCAWTAMYMIAVLATMYWLETQVATELRARREPAGSGDIKDPDRLIAPGARRGRLLLELPGRRSGCSPTSCCTCSRSLDGGADVTLDPAAVAAGWGSWSLDPPAVLTADLAFLYWLGSRRTVTPRAQAARAAPPRPLLLPGDGDAVVALASPIEVLSEDLFWVHMVQHVLLMLVAAPLFVLARPWTRLWRALPLRGRRQLARWMLHAPSAAPLRAAARVLGAAGGLAGAVQRRAARLARAGAVRRDAALDRAARLEHTLFFALRGAAVQAADPLAAAALAALRRWPAPATRSRR